MLWARAWTCHSGVKECEEEAAASAAASAEEEVAVLQRCRGRGDWGGEECTKK